MYCLSRVYKDYRGRALMIAGIELDLGAEGGRAWRGSGLTRGVGRAEGERNEARIRHRSSIANWHASTMGAAATAAFDVLSRKA